MSEEWKSKIQEVASTLDQVRSWRTGEPGADDLIKKLEGNLAALQSVTQGGIEPPPPSPYGTQREGRARADWKWPYKMNLAGQLHEAIHQTARAHTLMPPMDPIRYADPQWATRELLGLRQGQLFDYYYGGT